MKKFIYITILFLLISMLLSAQNPIDSLLKVQQIDLLEKDLRLAKSQKEYTKCIYLLDTLINLNPKNAGYYYQQGFFYKKNNDMVTYEKLSNKALCLGYDTLHIYDDFYISYRNRQDYEKALYYAHEMVRMKPENPDLYLNIAGVYASMGDWKKYDEYFLIAANKGSKRANIIIEERKKEGTWQK